MGGSDGWEAGSMLGGVCKSISSVLSLRGA